MNSTKIAITAFSSLSPLGNNSESVWKKYLDNQHCFSTQFLDQQETSVASLDAESKEIVAKLRESDAKYKFLDDSVLFALAASRKAVQDAGWKEDAVFGINIGSSRGATDLFEKHYKEYIDTGKAQTLASPTTTLGNISSWIAHDLQSTGPEISHSITCSTALHALLNGVAWLKSGMADKFLVGGSEAPLTDFTIAQMRALKIYSRLDQAKDLWPNLAFDFEKTQNTMILGEGASVCCLEAGEKENAIAYISAVGYATEILEHNISISAEATCFQKSMKMALKDESPENIDVIVMHAPGTIKGDLTELRAIEKVFGAHLPLLTTNKWKIGHTFGASGMLSLELALLMMEHNKFVDVPFAKAQKQHKEIKKILINAVGFGGNAVSVLVEKA
ncbi:beta-ketoacyl synthase N-terminal-like domain-containing protein [Flavobacterium geliluteum]|uniref:Beta-ketoacyl synthase n=1 Tax=Flavobacterium geliluteum TaxID=2816120 RepID=A0A941B314_9FLAO|nr:beta-ketoacyl synthase N-terminal-like domain-containing protein [Flavobacterium geliluteum]MBP4138043.1 beta-ketoacyl synthase [Flavobacterium geliluteum]